MNWHCVTGRRRNNRAQINQVFLGLPSQELCTRRGNNNKFKILVGWPEPLHPYAGPKPTRCLWLVVVDIDKSIKIVKFDKKMGYRRDVLSSLQSWVSTVNQSNSPLTYFIKSSIDQSSNYPRNQRTSQSINQPTTQLISKSSNQPGQPINKPSHRPNNQPINRSTI